MAFTTFGKAPLFVGKFPFFREAEPGHPLLDWADRQRQRAHLAKLDDRMLLDIGKTRSMAEAESKLWT